MRRLLHTVKGIRTSILPPWYTQLEYVSNASSTRLDTWIYHTSQNTKFVAKTKWVLWSFYLLQSRGTDSSIVWISGSTTWSTITFNYPNVLLRSSIRRNTSTIYTIQAEWNNWTATLYVKNETDGIEDTNTATYSTFSPNNTQFCVWWNTQWNFINNGANIYTAQIRQNWVLVFNWIPCKDSNNVAGLYDTVSQTFKTATVWSIIAWPEV